jgi:hypothetical protein
MQYDINTIDELITALSGTTKVAEWADTGLPAISNWKWRGYIPPSRHLQILIEVRRRGKTINPALFEIDQKDMDLLLHGALGPLHPVVQARARAQ